jgi:hypothetical protein
MDKRTVISSPRILEIKKRKRRVLRNRAIFFSVSFLCVFVGLVFLSRWEKLLISNIEISGNKIVDTKLIKNVIDQELAGRYMWLFNKSNSFIYPRNALQYELTNKFKRLKDIKLEIKDLKTLHVSVSELEGKYTWCGESLPLVTAIDALEDSCYFVDNAGYIFDNAPYFSGSVYFKFFGKIQNMENGPIGRYFAPDYFESLVFFRDSIVDMGLKPYAFYVRDDGDIELYLQSVVPLSSAPKIIFKGNSDIVKLVENLQSTVAVEPLKTDLKQKYNSLKYIDLRFGNKIYYKFE